MLSLGVRKAGCNVSKQEVQEAVNRAGALKWSDHLLVMNVPTVAHGLDLQTRV
jgi:hypothetical protein